MRRAAGDSFTRMVFLLRLMGPDGLKHSVDGYRKVSAQYCTRRDRLAERTRLCRSHLRPTRNLFIRGVPQIAGVIHIFLQRRRF